MSRCVTFVIVIVSCCHGLRFDEAFGDAGRLTFDGDAFVGVLRADTRTVLVSRNGTWGELRGESLAVMKQWDVATPVAAVCQSERYAAWVGSGLLSVFELPQGRLVYHREVLAADLRKCAFIEVDRFVSVGAVGRNASVTFCQRGPMDMWSERTGMLSRGEGVGLGAVAVLPDATLAVVGSRASDGSLVVARLRPDGTVATWLAGVPPHLRAGLDVAVLPDGSLVVVGTAVSGAFVFFPGPLGLVLMEPRVMAFRSVRVLPRGRILLVGDHENHFVVAQVDAIAGRMESILWRAFGAKTVVVLGAQVLVDWATRLVAVGTVERKGIVLRLLSEGLHSCYVGPWCECNASDCAAHGFEPLVISSLDIGSRRVVADMSVELSRASRLKVVMPGGVLSSLKTLLLDGHMELETSIVGRLVVATAGVLTGRFTTVAVNVTKRAVLEPCLEYEPTQVLSNQQMIVSVSTVKVTACEASATSRDMPKGVVAVLVVLAMFFAAFGAVVVAQIVWKRRVEGGRVLVRSAKTRSVGHSAMHEEK